MLTQIKRPLALVEGVSRETHPFGLFSVATPREGSADRFETGIQFETYLSIEGLSGSSIVIGPELCMEDDLAPGMEQQGFPKQQTLIRSEGVAFEFTVYEMMKCSPIGNDLDHSQRTATEMLLLYEQAKVERALWAYDETNPFIGAFPSIHANSSTDPVGVSAVNKASGLIGTLEQRFMSIYGSLGVLHMPWAIASDLAQRGRLEVSGGRLHAPLGTPVVAGVGYAPDTFPDTGSGVAGSPIYITPPPVIYRSEIFTSAQESSDLLDTRKNDLYGVAERTYVVGFDAPASAIFKAIITPEV